MYRPFRSGLSLFAFVLGCLVALCLPHVAHAADETMASAVRQSDGIVSRVVDDLWQETDVYWHKGDYNRIIALDRVCVSADPSFVEVYSTGAWLMWSMGDSDAADTFLRDGIERSPARADITYAFAEQLFNTKRYPEAAKYLRQSIAFGDNDRLAYTMLAHSYRLSGKYDDSIAEWKLVIKKFPDFAAAKPNLARVEALKRGIPDRAHTQATPAPATAH
jgi:tetratricopeptide (TPR) repeat protein